MFDVNLNEPENLDTGAVGVGRNRIAKQAGIAAVRREVRARMNVRQFEGPDTTGNVVVALWSLAVIALAAYIVTAAWATAGALSGILLYLIGLPLIARQQRVLELLVHDGSHGAFGRLRWLNDFLCDVLAGAPVMQLTSSYRRTHKVHHQQFGSDLDPCRGRTFMRGPGTTGIVGRLRSIAAGLPKYLADYYGSVASTTWRPLTAALAWHGAAIVALSLTLGILPALAAWGLFWAAPFVIALPVIRMMAEADEHDYGKGCEAAGTFTNLGWLNGLIVHPGNDQFHLAHHAFPAIAIRRLRRFDRMARRVSPLYAAMPVRNR